MSNERQDMNKPVIEEFRANGGAVGGYFAGMPLVLLHHIGAKSGEAYVSPLARFDYRDGWAIVASNAGRDNHPAWYHNLQARPATSIEVPTADGGVETVAVTARVIEGAERDELFDSVKTAFPQFAGYEQGTERRIPLVALERSA